MYEEKCKTRGYHAKFVGNMATCVLSSGRSVKMIISKYWDSENNIIIKACKVIKLM